MDLYRKSHQNTQVWVGLTDALSSTLQGSVASKCVFLVQQWHAVALRPGWEISASPGMWFSMKCLFTVWSHSVPVASGGIMRAVTVCGLIWAGISQVTASSYTWEQEEVETWLSSGAKRIPAWAETSSLKLWERWIPKPRCVTVLSSSSSNGHS